MYKCVYTSIFYFITSAIVIYFTINFTNKKEKG